MVLIMEEQEFTFESETDFSTSVEPSADAINLSLTVPAEKKLRHLFGTSPDKLLRLRVQAGGCSGYQYEFSLDDKQNAVETEYVKQNDVSLLVDSASAGFLQNAIVDFQQNLAGENFQVINPNATNSCGCGVSFST